MNTRGLSGMTTNRIADEDVTIVYKVKDPQDDGSSIVSDYPISVKGSVVPLPPKEIERLEVGGIVIRNGISIALAKAPALQPDYVLTADSRKWRVVAWTFIEEYDSGTDPYGTVIATCDEVLIDHN